MVDIRHHIVTICALFLMLAVGILIGQRFAAPAQVKQQTVMLARLKNQVDGAVQDGMEAKRRLGHTEHAIDILRNRLIPGKLSGKRIVIVQCGDYPDATRAAKSAVEDAGATAVATVVIADQLVLLQDGDRTALLKSMNAAAKSGTGSDPNTGTSTANAAGTSGSVDDPAGSESENATVADIISPMAGVLRYGSDSDTESQAKVSELQDQRYITITGDVSQPCNFFVIVGGRTDNERLPAEQVSDTELAVINGLLGYGTDVTVVGCEPLEAKFSSIATYQKASIATVDCVDQPLGQFDLPFALRGGDRADYGLKGTATRELPESFEEALPTPPPPNEEPATTKDSPSQ